VSEIEILIEKFWSRLEGIFQLLANQLLTGYIGFKFQIGNSSNSVFPLRAYLIILRSNTGDELSITVDIKNIEDGFLIESDVVGEEGKIIVDGPLLELHEELSDPLVQVKIDKWFESFEQMFIDKFDDIDAAIKYLAD